MFEKAKTKGYKCQRGTFAQFSRFQVRNSSTNWTMLSACLLPNLDSLSSPCTNGHIVSYRTQIELIFNALES